MTNRLHRWSPPLRRAVMRVRPEFFSWPVKRQERFGVSIPRQDRDALEEALLQELFSGKRRRSAPRDASDLSLDQQNRWNEAILPLIGIGEDCFYLNEYFQDDETILDFPTLLAYDRADHLFQEEARKQEDPSYQSRPYRGTLYLAWGRLFVGQSFTYATLSMAAGYIYSQLQDAADDFIDERIPHRYVPGKNHGKREGGCWQWDLRVDANGQEGILDELTRRVCDYTSSRYDALLTSWDAVEERRTYLIDTSEPPETNLHFVFANTQTLGAVRLRSFLRDCRTVERPRQEIDEAVRAETTLVTAFIREQHEDLQRNFDPKVARLRKRRKIMMHENALEDFQ